MHRTYQIITDATADMVPEMLVGLPEVQVIPMGVTLGEKAYTYGPGGDITVEEFYAAQRDGKFATTSQINPTVYLEYFEACLQKGEDVLYLCLTSGVSGTFQTASLCAAELQEKYPRRQGDLHRQPLRLGGGGLPGPGSRPEAERGPDAGRTGPVGERPPAKGLPLVHRGHL